MINKAKNPSEMGNEELAKYMIREFNQDAIWRDTVVGGEATYNECINLYESHGAAEDGTDIPQLPLIKEPVNDAISLAAGVSSRVRLKPVEVIDSSIPDDARDFFMQQIHQASEVNNRHVDTVLFWSQYKDQRAKAMKHAGIFGVGFVGLERDGVIDVKASNAARRLRWQELDKWTEADWRLAHQLANRANWTHVDTREIYYRRGVNSPWSPEMTRVWRYRKRNYGDSVAKYPDAGIRPGAGRWGLQDTNYFNANDAHLSVGELNLWEIEVHPITKTLPNGSSVPMWDYKVVHARMIGSKVVFKEVITSGDGMLCLPFVPYYLMESENHPYGFSLARALRITAEYVNSMLYAAFAQAKKSVSPQSLIILASKLAKQDSVEDMTETLREGDVLTLYANKDIDNINQVVSSAGQLSSSLGAATLQAIDLGRDLLYRHASSPNREAIANTESGRAKEAELAVADRGNTMMTDTIARSDELVYDMTYEYIQVHFKNTMAVPIRNARGEFESVTVNQPATELLPVPDPITGEPMVSESFVIPGINDEGYMFKRVDFVKNSTNIDMVAEAEVRSEIPTAWAARFKLFMQLAQIPGLLRSQRTARDFILPDEIQAADDKNWGEDQAILQQQALQQAMLAGGLDPQSGGQLPGGGPTPEQQLQNAVTGRNTPQPNGALRDTNQDFALTLQAAS